MSGPWIVWRPRGKRRPPKFVHETRDSAEAEAARLAELRPDRLFYVMEAVAQYGSDNRVMCPGCSKMVEPEGLEQHQSAVHCTGGAS